MLQQAAFTIGLAFCMAAADTPDTAAAKAGLKDLGEFIGQWNLQAENKAAGKTNAWKETLDIAWKFKGDDAWIAIEPKDSRHLGPAELRYDPASKRYTLAMTRDGKRQDFTGELKRGRLLLTAEDKTAGTAAKISINTLSEGVRINLVYEVQTDGPFETLFKAAGTKEGESFAGGKGAKKPECIVTGGAASIAVTYMGKTYYVCCTGCRDEFNDNPKKYVEEFEKKQAEKP